MAWEIRRGKEATEGGWIDVMAGGRMGWSENVEGMGRVAMRVTIWDAVKGVPSD